MYFRNKTRVILFICTFFLLNFCVHACEIGGFYYDTNMFCLVGIGSAKRNECSRDNRQAGPALAAQPELVHPGHLRHLRRRVVRRARLALQPTEKRQPLTACAQPTHI